MITRIGQNVLGRIKKSMQIKTSIVHQHVDKSLPCAFGEHTFGDRLWSGVDVFVIIGR